MFVFRHPTLGLRVGSVGRSVGIFYILVKVSLVPRVLPLFDKSRLLRENTFLYLLSFS